MGFGDVLNTMPQSNSYYGSDAEDDFDDAEAMNGTSANPFGDTYNGEQPSAPKGKKTPPKTPAAATFEDGDSEADAPAAKKSSQKAKKPAESDTNTKKPAAKAKKDTTEPADAKTLAANGKVKTAAADTSNAKKPAKKAAADDAEEAPKKAAPKRKRAEAEAEVGVGVGAEAEAEENGGGGGGAAAEDGGDKKRRRRRVAGVQNVKRTLKLQNEFAKMPPARLAHKKAKAPRDADGKLLPRAVPLGPDGKPLPKAPAKPRHPSIIHLSSVKHIARVAIPQVLEEKVANGEPLPKGIVKICVSRETHAFNQAYLMYDAIEKCNQTMYMAEVGRHTTLLPYDTKTGVLLNKYAGNTLAMTPEEAATFNQTPRSHREKPSTLEVAEFVRKNTSLGDEEGGDDEGDDE